VILATSIGSLATPHGRCFGQQDSALDLTASDDQLGER